MHLHFPLGNAIPPYLFFFHFMKRCTPYFFFFYSMNTNTPYLSIFYCKRAVPPYLFFSLYEMLFHPHTFFFHSMKRWYSLLLLFLLYETLTLHTSLFFIVKRAIPPFISIFHSFKRCSLHIPSFSTL